jgi:hypothetical protein
MPEKQLWVRVPPPAPLMTLASFGLFLSPPSVCRLLGYCFSGLWRQISSPFLATLRSPQFAERHRCWILDLHRSRELHHSVRNLYYKLSINFFLDRNGHAWASRHDSYYATGRSMSLTNPNAARRFSRQCAVRFCGRSGIVSSVRSVLAIRSSKTSSEFLSTCILQSCGNVTTESNEADIFVNAQFRHYPLANSCSGVF